MENGELRVKIGELAALGPFFPLNTPFRTLRDETGPAGTCPAGRSVLDFLAFVLVQLLGRCPRRPLLAASRGLLLGRWLVEEGSGRVGIGDELRILRRFERLAQGAEAERPLDVDDRQQLLRGGPVARLRLGANILG